VAWAGNFLIYCYYKCWKFFYFIIFSEKKNFVKKNEESLGILILEYYYFLMESAQSLNYQQTFVLMTDPVLHYTQFSS
jgi:hypothetical protein